MKLITSPDCGKKKIKIVLVYLCVVGMTACTFFDAASQSFRLTMSNEPGRAGLEQNVNMRLPLAVEFDQGGNIIFRSFIAPKNAIYHFDAQLNFSYPLADDSMTVEEDDTTSHVVETKYKFYRWYLNLYKGAEIIESSVLTNNNNNSTAWPKHSLAISTTIFLQKGEAVSIGFNFEADPGEYVTPDFISFSGFKVQDIPIKIMPVPLAK